MVLFQFFFFFFTVIYKYKRVLSSDSPLSAGLLRPLNLQSLYLSFTCSGV